MIDKGNFMSTAEIENRILSYLLKHQEVIASWSAQLLGLCDRPSNHDINEFCSLSEESENVGKYEWSLSISNYLTVSELKILTIMSQFLQSDIKFFIDEGLISITEKKQFSKHIDQMIYMSGKLNTLLYLTNSTITTDSFFGQLTHLIEKIKREVEYNSKKLYTSLIFSLPFWKPQGKNKIQKYTGWSRHHKDSGTLRSENYHYTNILDDTEYQEQCLRKKEDYLKSTQTLISLTLGWIQ